MGLVYIQSGLGRGLWLASCFAVNTNPGGSWVLRLGDRVKRSGEYQNLTESCIQYDRVGAGGMQSIWKLLFALLLLALTLAEPHGGPVELTNENFYEVCVDDGKTKFDR